MSDHCISINIYKYVKIRSNHNEYTLCIITEEHVTSDKLLQDTGRLLVSNAIKNPITIYSFIDLTEIFIKVTCII